MLRNLIFGSLLAPLGAALPFVVLFIAVGFVRAIAEADVYPLSAGLSQSLYAVVAAYVFGWIAALLVGAGNGIVWLLVFSPGPRLLLSIPVGALAALLAFGHMLFGAGGLGNWPTPAMYSALGAIGSFFSALIIGIHGFASKATA